MVFWRRAAEMKRRAAFLASQTFVVLAIQVPKDNEKTAASAEQFFAALHGIYRNDPPVQEHISLEIVATKDSIFFYIFAPLHLREFIEGQLYAQYPNLNIKTVSDYSREVDLTGMHVATTRIKLTKEEVYPIKTYTSTEVDPLAGITAVMSNLDAKDHLWLQVVIRPIGDNWQSKGVEHVKAVRSGKKPLNPALKGLGHVGSAIALIAREVAQPGSATGTAAGSSEPPKLSAPEEAALKAIEGKITKLGFETIFRMVSIAPDENAARARSLSFLGALKQFNTTNLNGFAGGDVKVDDFRSWEQYLNREFEEKGSILNIEEVASVYHFPTTTVEANAIQRSGAKKGEAPFNVPLKEVEDPSALTIIGKTDFRNKYSEFGVKLDDRKRHIYVIGKSGTGKSTLLENMVIDDINLGRGVIVVDPHGEFADKIIDSIPERRIQDVVVLDPADREWPIAFNLLEYVGEDFKGMVASGFVGIFKKIFGNSWGPRLEHILRNTVLALLETPGSTMLGIPRMLTDKQFRESVVVNITDPVIKDFWTHEWAGMDQKQQSEALGPILNKVGQFLSTGTIRNIVGQPKSTIDIRKIMDQQQILIVNLSKGKIGEDNSALLGAMIVTKVQLAAMSRANVAVADRPDCFLYVDEFQNFATDSFATILSEARKYNLGLTIAHQYIAQLPEEVRDAVIGNVGSMILFRVGVPDAEALAKEFEPVFAVADMVNLEKAHVYVKLLVDGFASQPFSAQTLPPRTVEQSFRQQVIAYSREQYSRPRADVEADIEEAGGYRQKREAQAAKELAASILQGGAVNQPQQTQQQQGQGRPQPVMQPAAAPRPQVQQVQQHAPHPAPVAVVAPPPVQPQQAAPAPVQQPLPPPPQVVQPQVVPPVVMQQPIAPLPVAPQPEQQAIPTQQVTQPETGEPEPIKEAKPRKEKPPKIMNGWVYREVSQRGGMRWFLGEPEKEYLARKEEKERQKEQGLTDGGDQQVDFEVQQEMPQTAPILSQPAPPTPLPATEQTPNEVVAPVIIQPTTIAIPVTVEKPEGPVAQQEHVSLQEGASIQL